MIHPFSLRRPWLTALLLGLVTLAQAQLKAPVSPQEKARLQQLGAQFQQERMQRMAAPDQLRAAIDHPLRRVAMARTAYKRKGQLDQAAALPDMDFIGLANGKPLYYASHSNVAASVSTMANLLFPGGTFGLNLTGQNRVVYEWDGGGVRTTHQEFGGRVTQRDSPSGLSDHATHVAGTLIGSGFGANTTARGMAYTARLNAYDWNSDSQEMSAAAAEGALMSNHSYGVIAGFYWDGVDWYWYGDESVSTTEDYKFGYYDSYARQWDQIANAAPYYLILKSAGNNRGYALPNATPYYVMRNGNWVSTTDVKTANTGYDNIASAGVAKNILTIGSVADVTNHSSTAAITSSSFSSYGPTDDGRIKPDLVANGEVLYSAGSASDASYTNKSGTSMATPNATGSLVLVQQYYNQLGKTVMLASSLKALAINTAWETGTSAGPDYRFGWGLLNVSGMVTAINQLGSGAVLAQKTLSQGGSFDTTITVGPGQIPKVTLVWNDPAATVGTIALNNRTAKLVNDLDLRLTAPGGTVYQPWKLDPLNPANAATRGDNVVDNVEQVEGIATTGTWTIRVSHKGTLSGSSQRYSLVVTGISPITASNTYGIYFASPTVNQAFIPGDTVNMGWFNNGTGRNYRIDLQQGGSTVSNIVNSYNSPGGNYTWVIPANTAAGNYNLRVTDLGTQASTGTVAIVINQAPPTITGLSPTSGVVGTSVTITGTNFTNASAVRFNGVNAASFNVVSATSITATVPTTANTGTVQVVTPGGTATSASNFTVTPSVTVNSINRNNASPNNATSLTYAVSLSGSVTGLSTSNFSVNASGITGASVTGISGSGSSYTVTVNTGTGSGTLRLDVANATSVSPTIRSLPYTSGQTYTIDKTAPTATVSSSEPNPTSSATVLLSITFSEPVTGLTASDFAVTNGSITGVAGTGAAYAATLNITSAGVATVRLNANGVVDAVNNGNTQSNLFSITYVPPITDLVVTSSQSASGTYNSVTVRNGATLTLAGALTVNNGLTVENGGTLNTGCFAVTGTGSFTLAEGGTLHICHASGITTGGTGAIQTTGTRTFNPNATYVYDGGAAQNTGNALPATVRNLRIANSNGVTLSQALAITNRLEVSSGFFNVNNLALRLLANASQRAVLTNVNSGTLTNAANTTFETWLDPTLSGTQGTWAFVGAPVSGGTVASWGTNNALAAGTFDRTNTGNSSLFVYDPLDASAASTNGWTKLPSANTALAPGRGYHVWFRKSPFFTGDATSRVTGTPALGAFTFTLPYCSSNCPSGTAPGFNLVANPYAAPIDWELANGWNANQMSGYYFIYSAKNQQYSYYLRGVGGVNNARRIIPPGQGFMVQANNASGSLQVLPQAVTNALNQGTMPSIYRQASGNQLRLIARQSGPADELLLVNDPTAARGNDANDVPKLFTGAVNVGFQSVDGLQAIASLPIAQPLDTLPVRLFSTNATTALIELSISPQTTLTGYSLWVRDRTTNTTWALHPGSPLNLPSDGGTVRYDLLINLGTATDVRTTSTPQLRLWPNPATNSVTVAGATPGTELVLVNTLGQEVSRTTASTGATTLQVGTLPAGVYTLQARDRGRTTFHRLVKE